MVKSILYLFVAIILWVVWVGSIVAISVWVYRVFGEEAGHWTFIVLAPTIFIMCGSFTFWMGKDILTDTPPPKNPEGQAMKEWFGNF